MHSLERNAPPLSSSYSMKSKCMSSYAWPSPPPPPPPTPPLAFHGVLEMKRFVSVLGLLGAGGRGEGSERSILNDNCPTVEATVVAVMDWTLKPCRSGRGSECGDISLEECGLRKFELWVVNIALN